MSTNPTLVPKVLFALEIPTALLIVKYIKKDLQYIFKIILEVQTSALASITFPESPQKYFFKA